MSTSNSTLTAERLRELLDYSRETGHFFWRVSVSSTGRAGRPAGCLKSAHGYTVIRIDKRLYLAHRLAFLHVTGEWPTALVDHIDMNKANNRWENLRPATKSQNAQNKSVAQSNNLKSGLLGIYWSERNKSWGAKVNVDRKQHHGGFHPTPEAAHAAYVELKRKHHPFGML